GALVDHRTCDVGAPHDLGPGQHGPVGQDLVEGVTGTYQAETWVFDQCGPGEFEAGARADDVQALVLDPPLVLEGDPHRGELFRRPRGQSVAADLVPAERALLQEQDDQLGLDEVIGGCGTGRSCADNDDVSVIFDLPPASGKT